MRIGYYLHYSALRSGGIFTYSIGLLKLLLEIDQIEKIYLIHSEDQKEYVQEHFKNPKIKFILIKRFSTLNKIRFSLSYFLAEVSFLYSQYLPSFFVSTLNVISRVINPYSVIDRLKIDLLHVPMQYSPIYGTKTPVITTLHDVQEFHFPENFSSDERLHRAINTKKSIEKGNHVIVSFEHIRADLLKYFNVPSSKISVCPPPFHMNWFASGDVTPKEELLDKFKLPDQFLLYPAATWIHKNHLALLEALKYLNDLGRTYNLVCTGHQTDYFSETILPKIRELNLNGQVYFLGIVSESDLNGLYKACQLVVIPTRYEAGSGPLYEAMKLGVPVICANTTSLPETVGNPKFIFDPKNPKELSVLIANITSDAILMQENLTNSKKRMDELGESDYRLNFISAYKRVVGQI